MMKKKEHLTEGQYLSYLTFICLTKGKEIKYDGAHYFHEPSERVIRYEDDFISVEKSESEECSVILFPPLVETKNPIITIDKNKKVYRSHGENLFFRLYVERLFGLDLTTKIYRNEKETLKRINSYVEETIKKHNQEFANNNN